MFRIFSKAAGEELKYVKTANLAVFDPLMQYVCEGKSGKKYLALLSDGALSDFYFDRAYTDPPKIEGEVSPAKVFFCGDAGGYTLALIELPERAAGAQTLKSPETETVLLTAELRERSLAALLSAYPPEIRDKIRLLPSFEKYKGILEHTESARLVWEFGNLTPENLYMSDSGPAALNAMLLRPLQPEGYDILTLGGKKDIPNAGLNAAKAELAAEIAEIIRRENQPEIIGDWDYADPSCPQPDSDYIYNRFDWLYGSGRVIAIRQWGREQRISVNIGGANAALGLWLVPVSSVAAGRLCSYIFETYRKVKRIRYRFMLHPLGSATETNHYHIVIPSSPEQLYASLSQHGRYDVRRKKRLAEQDLGGFTVTKMEKAEVPLSLVETYYEYKKKTYNVPYLMPPQRYMDAYHVSHVYRLDTASRGMEALLFSCEQGDTVYLENLTYDPQFKKYSIGQTLYDYYLNQLIEMKKKRLYLAGGRYEYKTRFGSVELIAYNGEVWRSGLDRAAITIASKLRSGIRRVTGRVKKY